MKKLFIVILSFVIIMAFSACSEKTKEPNESNNLVSDSSSQPSESNNVNSEPVNFDFSAEVPAKTPNTESGGYGICDYLKIYKNTEEIAAEAEFIIRGRVKESHYVLSYPYSVDTKSTVIIDEVYKGDLKEGDKISVIENGGFIPNGVYSNAISLEKFGKEASNKDDPTIVDIRFDGRKVMEEGEKVVLFLNKIVRPDAREFKVGCYEGSGVFLDKFLYHEEIDAYAPYIPKKYENDVEAKIYKENELRSIVQDKAVL